MNDYPPPPDAVLLPRHRIVLNCARSPSDVPKFVSAWRSTWRRLPLGARRDILRFWRTANGFGFDVRRMTGRCPAIDVQGLPLACGDSYAAVLESGARICFNPDAVHDMPAEVLETLIAHELAHVVRRGNGWEVDPGKYHNDWWAYLEEEEAVGYDLAAWGFDDESIDVWARTNRDSLPWLAELKDNVNLDRHPARKELAELAAVTGGRE